jgi:hypothetical protein
MISSWGRRGKGIGFGDRRWCPERFALVGACAGRAAQHPAMHYGDAIGVARNARSVATS